MIGEALRQSARGDGHRRIARRLDRPSGTVRGRLRASRSRAELLRCSGVRWAYVLDPQLGRIKPAGSPLGDALTGRLPARPATRAAVADDLRGRAPGGDLIVIQLRTWQSDPPVGPGSPCST